MYQWINILDDCSELNLCDYNNWIDHYLAKNLDSDLTITGDSKAWGSPLGSVVSLITAETMCT
jgi:hypothetical protein